MPTATRIQESASADADEHGDQRLGGADGDETNAVDREREPLLDGAPEA